MRIWLVIGLLLTLGALAPVAGAEGLAGSSTVYLPWLAKLKTSSGTIPPVPFRQTGDLFLLNDATGDGGQSSILRITPDRQVNVAVTQAEILAATGQGTVDFDERDLAIDQRGAVYFGEAISGGLLKWVPGQAPVMLASQERMALAQDADTVSLGGLTVGWDGLIYATDKKSDSILRIHPDSGIVEVFVAKRSLTDLDGISSISLQEAITSANDGSFYVVTTGTPDALLRVTHDGIPSVVITEAEAGGLLGRMTRAANGDLLIGAASRDAIQRISPSGVVSTFLATAELTQVTGLQDFDLEGGTAFDDGGNFYLLDERSGSILRFDFHRQGTIWIEKAELETTTGSGLNFAVGIAFAPAGGQGQ